MRPTGRLLAGPGSRLVEVVSDEDLKHMAVVFEAAYRDHPCLNGDLETGMGFMEQPEVTGLSRLVARVPEGGAFVYPTGTVWSVAEVVRELASAGETGGVKAALELCFLAGEILVEASDKGVHSGLDGHGSIDPWKVMLKADGQISIVGYGLPRPEIEIFLDDENRLPSEDGLRYCAPETLGDEPISDIGSDLFSLTLLAMELMVGRPVYDGLVKDVRQQASRGEAVRRLYQWRDKIPEPVREVLGKALKPDPDIRYRDGLDYVYSIHDLLGGIDAGDGPSLRELVTKVRARQKRGRAVVGGNTGALTMAELAELAADIDEEGVATKLPTPRQPRPDGSEEDDGAEKPRWRRSTRNASKEEPEPERGRRGRRRGAKPEEAEASDDSPRNRLLKRLRNRDDGDSGPRRRRRPSSDGDEEAPPDRPRRRGRARAERTEPKKTRRRREKPAPEVEETDEEATQVQDETELEKVAVLAKAEEREAKAEEHTTKAAERDEKPPSRRRRPGGRAAALLERLRSSSGGETRTPRPTDDIEETVTALPKPAAPPLPPEPEVTDDDDELETAVIPPEAIPDSVKAKNLAIDTEDDATENEATVVAKKRPRPQKQPEPADDPQPESAPEPAPDSASDAASDASPTPAAASGPVRVAYAGDAVEVASGPASVVLQRALDALDLASTDLLGNRTAGYRLRNGKALVAFDAEAPAEVTLEKVDNGVVMAHIEVAGKPPTRLKTPLGTAIPVRELKRALAELLDLPSGLTLKVGKTTLADEAFLADHAPKNGQLELKVLT